MKSFGALLKKDSKLVAYQPALPEHQEAVNRLVGDFIAALDKDRMVDELLKDKQVLLLKVPVAGYVGFIAYVELPKEHAVHISSLGIGAENQGHGYGKCLLALALVYFQKTLKAKQVRLGVRVGNTIASTLYESLGFVKYAEGTEEGIHFELLKFDF